MWPRGRKVSHSGHAHEVIIWFTFELTRGIQPPQLQHAPPCCAATPSGLKNNRPTSKGAKPSELWAKITISSSEAGYLRYLVIGTEANTALPAPFHQNCHKARTPCLGFYRNLEASITVSPSFLFTDLLEVLLSKPVPSFIQPSPPGEQGTLQISLQSHLPSALRTSVLLRIHISMGFPKSPNGTPTAQQIDPKAKSNVSLSPKWCISEHRHAPLYM